MGEQHVWTREEDIVAFYLSRFGDLGLVGTPEMVAARLGINVEALRMRIQNFNSLDGRKGLKHPAAKSKAVFEEFRGVGEGELRAVVLGDLASGRRG